MGGYGDGRLEQPRPWLGAQWAGLSPGSAEPARAVRRALSRHRRRAGALPRGAHLTMLRGQQISTLAGPSSKSPVQLALSNEVCGQRVSQ